MDFLDATTTALTEGIYVGLSNEQYAYLALSLFVGIFLALFLAGLLLKAIGAK